MNRSKLKAGVNQISLNGKLAKLSTKVSAGDKIEIEWEDNIPDDIEPEDLPLDIIYEDENVTLVNKAQGMVTHPAAGNWTGTLVNGLLFHWGRASVRQLKSGNDSEILERRRPGIVHRLDKDTSGLIITAKNRFAEEWLNGQFKNRRNLAKVYIAICQGLPPVQKGFVETQIIRDPGNRKRFKAVTGTDDGKFAKTRFRCIACYGSFSLMAVKIYTGRTHQIRVHMKYLGCPILGDPLYGSKVKSKIFPDASLMLHSYMLKILLPGHSECSTFRTRTPGRFKSVLRKLHSSFDRSSVIDSQKKLPDGVRKI